MKISILCASRGRPSRFSEMVESAMATASRPGDVSIDLLIDYDDPALNAYFALQSSCSILVNTFHKRVGALFNDLVPEATGNILMACGDDVLFRTRGWDTRVLEVARRFPDGLFIASPNNGDGKQRVNHWFTGRQWVDVFGWFMPAHFEHFGDDNWVQEVAASCGRLIYMPDVLIEHMHKKYRKSADDETYQSKRMKDADGSCMSKRDEALFASMTAELTADGNKLRNAIHA